MQPADVFSVQFNAFSGNDGAGEFWAVGDKMVKSCDILARSCSKGIFGGNGVLQSALSVTFSSAPSFVITGMADGDIYFWSAGSLITRNQNAHPGGVTCVAWFSQMSEKGPVSRLISGGKDEYLRVWDMSDRVASLTATLQSRNPQPFPLISKFFFAPVLTRSLGTRAAVVSLDYRQESDCLAVGTSKNSLFTVELSAFIPAQSPSTADAPAAHRALAKDLLRILSSGHSGEIGALAMVTWQGLQCAVTASMDGTVRTKTCWIISHPTLSHFILRFDCGICASERKLHLPSFLPPSGVFTAAPMVY
jgi:WD40 repeat protein